MENEERLKLPTPQVAGKTSIEEALTLRRTVRTFSSKEVDSTIISQLLWALQGTTYVEDATNGKQIFHKAAPSAGKTYPLMVYVASAEGFHVYEPKSHSLRLVCEGDVRESLSEAAMTQLNREAIKTAPLTIILTADNERALKATTLLENALRFVHLEAGHAAQNMILQAVAFGLGVCTITSFNIAKVYDALKLPFSHRPIYLLPIGFPKASKRKCEK